MLRDYNHISVGQLERPLNKNKNFAKPLVTDIAALSWRLMWLVLLPSWGCSLTEKSIETNRKAFVIYVYNMYIHNIFAVSFCL